MLGARLHKLSRGGTYKWTSQTMCTSPAVPYLTVKAYQTGCAKNDPTCFCQNFVKSLPNLIIFGTQTIELCKVHHCPPHIIYVNILPCKTQMLQIVNYMVIISIRLLTCAISVTQRAPWNLIILWY